MRFESNGASNPNLVWSKKKNLEASQTNPTSYGPWFWSKTVMILFGSHPMHAVPMYVKSGSIKTCNDFGSSGVIPKIGKETIQEANGKQNLTKI